MGSVFIVDDMPGSARLIESLLAPDGHTMRTAGDGGEALQLVRDAPPDLVLMDVMMPLIDGFEACRAIKQNPETRLIPVVLVTSLDDTEQPRPWHRGRRGRLRQQAVQRASSFARACARCFGSSSTPTSSTVPSR